MAAFNRLALLSGAWLVAAGIEETRHLDGAYVIVNRASGRRIISGPSGFSASMGGPERPIYHEHRWKFVSQANDTYAIVNSANGMRIFAQTGKDHAYGFLTTDQGPIYQDQTWRALQQKDGSHVLANAKSGRVIAASVGLEGAAGFTASQVSSDSFAQDEAWWLIDPDQAVPADAKHCKEQLVEEEFKSLQLREEIATCSEQLALEAAERQGLASQLAHAGNGNEVTQQELDWLKGEVKLAWALAATILIFALGCVRSRGAKVKVVEDENKLDSSIRHAIFSSESEGQALRIVQIQCPGVEHSGIQVDLISDGCDVTMQRKASLGLHAMQWNQRFRFEPAEGQGSFEFREDRMELDHGLLKLVFQARSFQGRTVRFPQHYSLAASDNDMIWEAASTSAGSFEACSSPARSMLAKEGLDSASEAMADFSPSRGLAGGA